MATLVSNERGKSYLSKAVKWVKNAIPTFDSSKNLAKSLSVMNADTIKRVRNFYLGFPQYTQTPLLSLDRLASELGVAGIYIKDESSRFGLNAFKGLGAAFTLASFIAQKLGRSVWDMTYSELFSPELKRELGEYTFFATTDGNHGRAIAWAAKKIGQKCVIYMPKGCPENKAEAIRREGAEVYITDSNYDDTIRFTAELAEKTEGGVIIQDTAWEGYEDIPSWIMQGYGVVALEASEQLSELGIKPTHALVQAGVGAFAGASTGLLSSYYGASQPVTIVVESCEADCFFRSVEKGDGTTVNVGGDMDTIMAGLACGEPNIIAWDILKSKASYFAAIDDPIAARGMRVLGAPLVGDPRVVSGESGASSFGFLFEMLTNPELAALKEQAGIDNNSHILLFSTEGATNPDNYRQIVWNGLYPNY